LPVMRHAVEWHLNQGFDLDAVCCIYPTAPFLQPKYLRESLKLLRQDEQADFCFSATSFEFSIFRALKIDTQNNVSMFWPENEAKRSQDFPLAYHDAGQFYWGRSQAWMEKKCLFSSNAKAVLLPLQLVQDIDYPEDWLQAELKFKLLSDVSKS
jgi:pseudaminic acid cytidylyltransferase